ncbi:MAG: hypothetical protein A2Y24_01960 [Clostridiales bacterium GWE2_32_10]|nr:MAG: hypothetical protein A2Y24_01960 [Clostridiales bacterium GWE2_32_10]HBY21714.1 shikimate kinase [Clostridiales bacterium]
MKIALIGFMGSGKTTISKGLSNKMGYTFLDMDSIIETEMKLSVTQIFESYGEIGFRDIETKTLKNSINQDNIVIATGGGIVKKEENRKLLKDACISIYLKATEEQIYKNTENDTTRPLLNVPNKMEVIEKMMSERRPLYEKTADIVIDVTNRCVDDIVNEILEILNKRRI